MLKGFGHIAVMQLSGKFSIGGEDNVEFSPVSTLAVSSSGTPQKKIGKPGKYSNLQSF